MNEVTKQIQDNLASVVGKLIPLKRDAAGIYKTYFAAGVNTEVDALGGGASATTASKLKKEQVVSGITLCEQLSNFFTNVAVTQADHRVTCESLSYGNGGVPSPAPSVALESVGDKLKYLAQRCVEIQELCTRTVKLYNDNGVSTLASLSAGTVVFGAEMTVAELISGIVLAEQFNKILSNQAVATGSYETTLSLWERLL